MESEKKMLPETTITIPGWIYRQLDADSSRAVPGEGYGGWLKVPDLPFAPEHSALIVMHAWYVGKPGEFPGWERAVEYHVRARPIIRDYYPKLLAAARRAGLKVIHVVGDGRHTNRPEYRESVRLAGEEPASERIAPDPVWSYYQRFRVRESHPGENNLADIERGMLGRDFPPEVEPQPGEAIVSTSKQLFARCREEGVNHLVYTGFALNWCLLVSPGGMLDMSRYNVVCSTIREVTTAVENKETAATETAKAVALWRVALAYGFVYDFADFVGALEHLGAK